MIYLCSFMLYIQHVALTIMSVSCICTSCLNVFFKYLYFLSFFVLFNFQVKTLQYWLLHLLYQVQSGFFFLLSVTSRLRPIHKYIPICYKIRSYLKQFGIKVSLTEVNNWRNFFISDTLATQITSEMSEKTLLGQVHLLSTHSQTRVCQVKNLFVCVIKIAFCQFSCYILYSKLPKPW